MDLVHLSGIKDQDERLNEILGLLQWNWVPRSNKRTDIFLPQLVLVTKRWNQCVVLADPKFFKESDYFSQKDPPSPRSRVH